MLWNAIATLTIKYIRLIAVYVKFKRIPEQGYKWNPSVHLSVIQSRFPELGRSTVTPGTCVPRKNA
jgi:hypothetical protein